jgi:hypothetical protein
MGSSVGAAEVTGSTANATDADPRGSAGSVGHASRAEGHMARPMNQPETTSAGTIAIE